MVKAELNSSQEELVASADLRERAKLWKAKLNKLHVKEIELNTITTRLDHQD